MTCEETRKNLPLFLYGELSFDEEELVEVHIDECAACRGDLAREKAMFAALDGVELVPSPEALADSGADFVPAVGPRNKRGGSKATAAVADSDKDNSADNTPLMRHMGANRCMRRPQAVIPLVTPWSRYLLPRLTIRLWSVST